LNLVNIMKILFIEKIVNFYNKISLIIDCANVKKIKLQFICLFFLSILNFVFDLLSIFSVFPLIILVLDKEKFANYIEKYDFLNFINNISHTELIIIFAFSIFCLAIIKLLIISYFHFYKNRLFTTIQLQLSSYLVGMYLKSSYKTIISKPAGKIITNIKNECERIGYALRNLIDFTVEFFTLLIIGISILFINFKVSIMFILFLFLLSSLFSKILRGYNLNIGSVRSKYMALVTRYLLEVFNGIKTIKVSSIENKVINLFSKYDQNVGKQDIKFVTFQAFPRLFFEFILIITLLIVIIYVSIGIENKSSIIPILTLCGICSFRVLPAFSRIHVNLQGVKFTTNSINNICNEIKEGRTNRNIKEHLIKIDRLKDNELLNINSLTFSHKKNLTNLFENISFSVKKGEKIAIIGETGSGKSTFLDIVLGLLEPTSGEVVVNSSDLSTFLDLNKFYSYVPQQPFLVDGTISENIIFGKEDTLDIQKDNNIAIALEKSCSKEFVDKLENGLEAEVGENGVKLSLGQRQRINLARALYGKSKLLIMDEPTSALDPKIEEEIISNLCELSANTAIIMVTHKYDILKNFDSVYKLENKSFNKIV
jgi:ABC-type multidrug transport system fused ATPase/permease subunit